MMLYDSHMLGLSSTLKREVLDQHLDLPRLGKSVSTAMMVGAALSARRIWMAIWPRPPVFAQ
jgi:hypothetical protein